MGASVSTSAEAEVFPTAYASLPDNVHDMIEQLSEKDSLALLKPNPSAPPPFPPSLVGVVVKLDHQMASAALATVPRLQRKHYELIPKSLSELDFFVSFFSHLTAIVNANCEGAFDVDADEGSWKGENTEGANTFAEVWLGMDDAKKSAVKALCAKDSSVLLAPNPTVPAAFPPLPLGMRCFIDEGAATAALSSVPGLQYKHYTLVPNKLPEKDFWGMHRLTTARATPCVPGLLTWGWRVTLLRSQLPLTRDGHPQELRRLCRHLERSCARRT